MAEFLGGLWPALPMTLFAGLSTAIGGLFVLVKKDINSSFMSLALGFSGGVMIFISLTEILGDSLARFGNAVGEKAAYGYTMLAFFGGIILIALIDRLVPDSSNPHEMAHINPDAPPDTGRLLRSGVMTAVAIGLHNFPEGIATFSMSSADLSIGIPVTVAVAIHNIPEGIAVAAPIYKACGSRRKAFKMSLLSGLAEPAGGLLGYLLLAPFLSDVLLATLFAAVAGIMVFISLDELLPLAHEYGREHTAIYGITAGMAVMAVSLWLFM